MCGPQPLLSSNKNHLKIKQRINRLPISNNYNHLMSTLASLKSLNRAANHKIKHKNKQRINFKKRNLKKVNKHSMNQNSRNIRELEIN